MRSLRRCPKLRNPVCWVGASMLCILIMSCGWNVEEPTLRERIEASRDAYLSAADDLEAGRLVRAHKELLNRNENKLDIASLRIDVSEWKVPTSDGRKVIGIEREIVEHFPEVVDMDWDCNYRAAFFNTIVLKYWRQSSINAGSISAEEINSLIGAAQSNR